MTFILAIHRMSINATCIEENMLILCAPLQMHMWYIIQSENMVPLYLQTPKLLMQKIVTLDRDSRNRIKSDGKRKVCIGPDNQTIRRLMSTCRR